MGCMESRFRGKTRLTDRPDVNEMADRCDQAEQWTKLLASRSLMIDFRDADNRTFYEESDFVAECVRLHNLFRNRHLAPPLRLSPTLCHSAQSWANQMAHTGYFCHHNIPDIGENIFCRLNYLQLEDLDLTGKEVVDCWYRGNVHYNYAMEPNMLHVNAGAFTQMVWVGTEEIGLGKARSRDGKYVVVANYRPAGNVPGQFHENVARAVIRQDGSAGSPPSSTSFPSSANNYESRRRAHYAARRRATAADTSTSSLTSSSHLERGQPRSNRRRQVYGVH